VSELCLTTSSVLQFTAADDRLSARVALGTDEMDCATDIEDSSNEDAASGTRR